MVGMRKAPKMTNADELYLKKFIAARKNQEVAKIAQTMLDKKRI